MDDSSTSSTLHLPPLWRSLVVVLGLLFVLPASLSYWTVHDTLRQQNVCHVSSATTSPTTTTTTTNTAGTYVPLDDASYYWVKVPYEIRPLSITTRGFTTACWSITTLATTVLSPQTRHDREAQFRHLQQQQSSSSSSATTPMMIQWDQSHTIDQQQQQQQSVYPMLPMLHRSSSYPTTDDESSSTSISNLQQQHANRWCLIPGQDERMYKKRSTTNTNQTNAASSSSYWQEQIFGSNYEDDDEEDEEESPMTQPVFGLNGSIMREELSSRSKTKKTKTTTTPSSTTSETAWRICGPLQPSIMSHHDQPPYFVELPLQPPQSGRWHVLDMKSGKDDEEEEEEEDASSQPQSKRYYHDMMASDGAYSSNIEPPPQHDVQVQCHMSPQALPHLAQGRLGQPQPQADAGMIPRDHIKNLWWERAEVLHTNYNPLRLPTTVLVILWLVVSYIFRTTTTCTTTTTSQNVVEAIRQHGRHKSWPSLLWTVVWVYVLGGGLEPIVGTITYAAVHVTVVCILVVIVVMCRRSSSISSSSGSYHWTLFALAVLLAQVQPRGLFVGPLEVVSVTVGFINMNGLPWVIWAGSSILTHKPRRNRRGRRSTSGSSSTQKKKRSTRRRKRTESRHSSTRTDDSVDSASSQHHAEDDDDETLMDDEVWKYCLAASLCLGWILSHRLVQEIFAAPQWTIPAAMTGHLWWLHHQRQTRNPKRDESEHLRLLHPEVMDNDDATIFTVDTEAVDDSSLQLLQYDEPTVLVLGTFSSMAGLLGAVLLTILALLSTVVLDPSLAVGHVLVTILYVGAQYYSNQLYDPRQQDYVSLWGLYHMTGACVVVVVDIMTFAGWIQCHVLMTEQQHSSSAIMGDMTSSYRLVLVGALLVGQCLAHFAALLVTAMSECYWSGTAPAAGQAFWQHVQTVGEEARLWSYVFSC